MLNSEQVLRAESRQLTSAYRSEPRIHCSPLAADQCSLTSSDKLSRLGRRGSNKSGSIVSYAIAIDKANSDNDEASGGVLQEKSASLLSFSVPLLLTNRQISTTTSSEQSKTIVLHSQPKVSKFRHIVRSKKDHNPNLCRLHREHHQANPKSNINNNNNNNNSFHYNHLHCNNNRTKNKSTLKKMFFSDIYCTLSSASLTLLVLLACFSGLAQGSLYSSMQKLKIPEIIPITSSTGTVRVQLNGNDVKPGDPIPARSFKNLDFSKISWDYNDMDTRYTMMLLDLDRKPSGMQASNTTLSIYNQYTSVNIPGNLINGGQAIVAFDAPNVPCHPSTKHRLVLLVFHQDETIDIASIAQIAASTGYSPRRENFKLEDFINQNRLNLVSANIFSVLGESGGVCSGATSAMYTTSSILCLLMVMLTASAASIYRTGRHTS